MQKNTPLETHTTCSPYDYFVLRIVSAYDYFVFHTSHSRNKQKRVSTFLSAAFSIVCLMNRNKLYPTFHGRVDGQHAPGASYVYPYELLLLLLCCWLAPKARRDEKKRLQELLEVQTLRYVALFAVQGLLLGLRKVVHRHLQKDTHTKESRTEKHKKKSKTISHAVYSSVWETTRPQRGYTPPPIDTAVTHMQKSSPHKRFLGNAADPTCDSPSTLRRFALGTRNA